MSAELKPCPFCGGEASIRKKTTWTPEFVQCGRTCGASAYGVAEWNRRAESDESRQVRDALCDVVTDEDVGLSVVDVAKRAAQELQGYSDALYLEKRNLEHARRMFAATLVALYGGDVSNIKTDSNEFYPTLKRAAELHAELELMKRTYYVRCSECKTHIPPEGCEWFVVAGEVADDGSPEVEPYCSECAQKQGQDPRNESKP